MPNQNQQQSAPVNSRLAEALARLAMNQQAQHAAASAVVQNDPAIAQQLAQPRQLPVAPAVPQLGALQPHPNAVITPEELDAQPPNSEEMNREIDDLIRGIDGLNPFGTQPKPPAPRDRYQPPIHPNGRQTLMQQNAVPIAGVDPELWKYLTDEERALWKTS